ncbi:hypothetical protein GGR51DRAFT_577369 [Nemania sp. FL0031]|nr:hypothetical protein GGR51DRAFT_577369 [Nemania sp. FL0031]
MSASSSPGAGAGGEAGEMDWQKRRERDAQEWIDTCYYIPKDIEYDWRPFCEALVDNHRDAKGDFVAPSLPPRDSRGETGKPKDVIHGPDPAALAPAKGEDWKYVRYIPAWTDPDYREEIIETPGLNLIRNSLTTRDSLYNLRPALRHSDSIRNPTEYALRFGIAADRLDGRSRMSPSWSETRNPLADFTNQVNRLSDEERKLAVELSGRRFRQRNEIPPPGQEILPEVMELLLSQRGLLTNRAFIAEVEKAAGEGMSLDQMVQELERGNPETKTAHRVYLEDAMDDQDYQRLLLGGLTTDELIQHNIYTLSNDEVAMELDNPIHPLFDRPTWDNCEWKGRAAESPKLVYNINGIREEWNVATNDTLWEALQPAMRLISKMFSKRPPVLEALMDLTTRQPIPPESDGRLNPDTPSLAMYVLPEDIDLSLTYPAIRQLKEVYNYDWRENVLRVLSDVLILDIDWGFALAYQADTEDLADDALNKFVYGSTWYDEDTRRIRIRIAGDIIWPLLVPQYSKSEKMGCSFTIASTILHEFAHAIHMAVEALVSWDWAQPPGQDPAVTKLVKSLRGELYNSDWVEPLFKEYPQDEVGRDLEFSLWGCTSSVIGLHQGYPRHLVPLPIALGVESYPSAAGHWRQGAPGPVVLYLRPFSLDYMAKFFRKSFWDEEFEAYGFPAVRMRPDDLPTMVLVSEPTGTSIRMDRNTYGKDTAAFLRAVVEILSDSRQKVLAGYLSALKLEVQYRRQWATWWRHEIGNWEEETLYPLGASINDLKSHMDEASIINELYFADDQPARYTYWCSQQAEGDVIPFVEWEKELVESWREYFRYGGWLMQRLLAVHNDMHDDLGMLQRMVFHYLSVKPDGVAMYIRAEGAEDTAVGRIYHRLANFLRHAEDIVQLIGRVAEQPELVDIKDKWLQWEARFESHAEQYRELSKLFVDGTETAVGWWTIEQKAKFKRLPSGDWKHISERYKKMAYRDYIRAPAAVRDTIDDYLRQFQNPNPLNTQGEFGLEELEDAVKSLTDIDRRGPQPRPIFDFVVPPTQPQQDSQRLEIGLPSQPIASPSSDSVFGVPSEAGRRSSSLRGSPPRRVATHRVRKSTSATQQKSAFSKYVSNLLKAPDTEMGSEEARNLFASGIPQPILDLLPRGQPLAPTRGQGIAPFPNPYASRIVMTSEAIAFQEQQEAARKATQASGGATGVYEAQQLWREKRLKGDSDEEDGQS